MLRPPDLAVAIAVAWSLAACGSGGEGVSGTPGLDVTGPQADASVLDGSLAGPEEGGIDCDEAEDPCACRGFLACSLAGAVLCTEAGEVQTCRLDPPTGCLYLGPTAGCDDGLPCTGIESCKSGVGCIQGAPPAGCCEGDDDCDDGDGCDGIGFCELSTGTCLLTPPLVCDDGDPCNGYEGCSPWYGCLPAPPPPCDDGDACNGVESCDPVAGCVAGEPLDCDDGLPCTGLETCDPVVGCVTGAPPAGCCDADTDCDDGNDCNGVGACDLTTATCATTPPEDCDDGDLCDGQEACDPATGQCAEGPPPSCDDGNPCNGAEGCDPLTGCVAGAPVDCSGDLCADGFRVCNPTTGACDVQLELACDDGNPCNGVETCDGMLGCQAGVPLSCASDACSTGMCDPEAGGCVLTPVTCGDGDPCTSDECLPELGCVAVATSCDDGDPCTIDACSGGACSHVAASCDDLDLCTIDTCDPAAGGCVHEVVPCGDGGPCDLSVCTPTSGCLLATASCDDGDPCTDDACDDTDGCIHEPVACPVPPLSCQVAVCSGPAGGCEQSVLPGWCVIAGACIADGEPHPAACAVCDSEAAPHAWSPSPSVCEDDATPPPVDDDAGCPTGTVDLDGDPDTGCECDVRSVVDLCNGVDDDCDGAIDEDDPLADVAACTATCGGPCQFENGVGLCAAGECVLAACRAGWRDDDPDVPGCEMADVDQLVVDPDGAADTFATIGEALAVATDGATLDIHPGIYLETLVVDVPNVTLAGRGEVYIIGLAGHATIHVTQAGVVLRDLGLVGGTVGVHIDGADQVAIQRTSIEGLQGTAGMPEALGVRADDTSGLTIVGSSVRGVIGAHVPAQTAPRSATGVGILSSDDARVAGVLVQQIEGMDVDTQVPEAPVAGAASGFELASSTSCELWGNAVDGAIGGSVATHYEVAHVTGGSSAGVLVESGYGHDLRSNRLDGLAGGEGGILAPSGGPSGLGMPGGDVVLTVSPDNLVHGDPILYAHSRSDVVFSNVLLDSGVPGTTLGGVVAIDCAGVTITDAQVTGLRGFGAWATQEALERDMHGVYVSGSTGVTISGVTVSQIDGSAGATTAAGTTSPAQSGGAGYGILVEGCDGAQLSDCTVTDIRGGVGGFGDLGAGDGGEAYGLFVQASAGADLTNIHVERVTGGPAAETSLFQHDGGAGGKAIGVAWLQSAGLEVSTLRVETITGGGANAALPPDYCPSCVSAGTAPGAATGAFAIECPDSTLDHVGVYGIYAGDPVATTAEDAIGVGVFDSDGFALTQFTVHRVGDAIGAAVGVLCEAADPALLSLSFGAVHHVGAEAGSCVEQYAAGGVVPDTVAGSKCSPNPLVPLLDLGDPKLGDEGDKLLPLQDSPLIDGGLMYPGLKCCPPTDHPVCQEPSPNDGCDGQLGCVSIGPSCDDGDPCTDDVCEPATGACTISPYACPDDGLACTTEACAGGGCVSTLSDGHCLIDGACFLGADMHPQGGCAYCEPEGSPTSWTDPCPPLEGTSWSCPAPGVCEIALCADGYHDHNEDPADGCECGPDDACSLPDGPAPSVPFGVGDAQAAGGCAEPCVVPNGVAGCAAGACFVASCDPGWIDNDGDPSTGCNFDMSDGGKDVIEVDWAGVGSGTGAPLFTSLAAAAAAAANATAIHVYPGVYFGPVGISALEVDVLAVEGDVTLVGPPDGVTLSLSGTNPLVQGITVVGGRVGVRIAGIAGGRLYDVLVTGVQGEAPVGVEVLAPGARLSNVSIVGVHAVAATDPQESTDAVGVYAAADLGEIRGAFIQDIRAGDRPSGAMRGGEAAAIRLVQADEWWMDGVVVRSVRGAGVHGHAGEAELDLAVGGHAVAVDLGPSADNHTFRSMDIDDLHPGEGGAVGADGGAVAFFFDGSNYSQDIEQATVRAGGDPVVYGFGDQGRTVSGLTLDSPILPTSIARIALIACEVCAIVDNTLVAVPGLASYPDEPFSLATDGIFLYASTSTTVDSNTITGVVGAAGSAGSATSPPLPGTTASGIRAFMGSGLTVSHNVISDVRGGRGGASPSETLAPGAGGAAWGIALQGLDGCSIYDNSVSDLRGGPPGGYAPVDAPAAMGGAAVGVILQGGTGNVIDRLMVRHVEGGTFTEDDALACPTCSPQSQLGGPASGLELVGLNDATVSHVGVHQVTHVEPAVIGSVGGGVTIDDSNAVVSHVTIRALEGPMAGLLVRNIPSGASVKVQDSIVTLVAGACVGLVSAAGADVELTRVGLSACDATDVPLLGGDDPFDVEPLFSDLDELVLAEGSFYVDRGAPIASWPACDEPYPNGCKTNLGRHGGTEQATKSPEDAGHCDCP